MASNKVRKWAFTISVVVCLILLTAVALNLDLSASTLRLPIPRSLLHASACLPVISGVLLSLTNANTGLGNLLLRRKPASLQDTTAIGFSIFYSTAIIILASAVLLALLGTYAAPNDVIPGISDCGLQLQWLQLFKDKNAAVVRSIQDRYSCCGFRTSRDMAWPFPDHDHGADACEVTFGRTRGCLESWRNEQRRIAGSMMGDIGFLDVLVLIVAFVTSRNNLWSSFSGERDGPASSRSGQSQRHAIDYMPAGQRYTDEENADTVNEPGSDNAARVQEESGPVRVHGPSSSNAV